MQLRQRMSLTARLTMLFACASAAVLLAMGVLVGRLVDRHFEELDMETLQSKLQIAQEALKIARSPRDLDFFSQHLDDDLVEHSGVSIAIRGLDGKPLAIVGHADFPESMFTPRKNDDKTWPMAWKTDKGKMYRGISALSKVGITGWPPTVVAVAIDMESHEHFMASFQKTLWFVVVLAAIVNGLLGWAAVRHGLLPISAIRQRASEITANHLDQRLDVTAVPVELMELVQTLNAMLARLQESFQRLSDFSSDIAHELRTPVSNMLTQTHVILSKARSAEEYKDILYSNAEEFERLSRMIGDMLFLAKADHGLVSPFKEQVDIAAEVQNLFSYFDVLAEGKGVQLSLSGSGSVMGDRMLLRRAISNVLSNGIRHTPPSGRVAVSIERQPHELRIRIENTGEPIPPEHIPRLFDRFYRADAARHASSDGAGLGLAITKSIVTLHQGTIGVESTRGVTCFELRLPSEIPVT